MHLLRLFVIQNALYVIEYFDQYGVHDSTRIHSYGRGNLLAFLAGIIFTMLTLD